MAVKSLVPTVSSNMLEVCVEGNNCGVKQEPLYAHELNGIIGMRENKEYRDIGLRRRQWRYL